MQDYYVVRIGQWDRLTPITSAQFRIEKKGFHGLGRNADLYHHMPIPELKLKMDEELVVKKVKRRPAVLILREGSDPRRTATHFAGSGSKPNPNSHVFAPIISLRKEENLGNDYPQPFIDKVSACELPEFIHLPAEGKWFKQFQFIIHPGHTVEALPTLANPCRQFCQWRSARIKSKRARGNTLFMILMNVISLN